MFIVKYIRYASWSIKRIYSFKNEKALKVIVFYLLLTLLACFPYNYKIVQEGGFKNALFSEADTDQARYEFAEDTNFTQISRVGLEVNDDYNLNEYETYDFSDFTLIVDYAGNYDTSSESGVVLVYGANSISYVTDGAVVEVTYDGFTRIFNSRELSTDIDGFETFFTFTNDGFNKYGTIFSILSYTVTQQFMYALLIVVLAWIYTFIKKSWDTFLTYGQLLKIVVFSLTPGTVFSFLIGFIPNMYSMVPVVMNFMVAIISLLVMYKVARPDKDSHQHVVDKTRFIDAIGSNKKKKKKDKNSVNQEDYLL